MSPQRWFVLVVAICYGASTAAVAANSLVTHLGEDVAVESLCAVGLVVVAVIGGWLASSIRGSRPALLLNRVVVLGFSAVQLVVALVTGPQIEFVIQPVVVVICFVLIPPMQNWLKEEAR